MSQFKIYGRDRFIREHATEISGAIHRAAVAAFQLPESKRFHRFIPLESGLFFTPDDRSERYIIIECVLFSGRSVETKKAFYRELLAQLANGPGIDAQDIELTFIEAPRHDWLIRGLPGDELELSYPVETPPK